jgi:holo-[acyl-carrier protein] synthase
MIVGIGNDIVSVTDIEQSILKSSRYLQRVFCLSEQEYCDRQPNRFQHYAGCFSVKEAIMKALSTGWNGGVQWNHIEVGHYPSGMPRVILHHHAQKYANALNVKNIHISLSHTEQYATAIAILES